mmetsp:Transcript_34443/g.86557  ORF Transcript_34443/g.86557 Transcript_34443/m.86557 type:complete len:82 (-) Transcript_34443:53-298(-)
MNKYDGLTVGKCQGWGVMDTSKEITHAPESESQSNRVHPSWVQQKRAAPMRTVTPMESEGVVQYLTDHTQTDRSVFITSVI